MWHYIVLAMGWIIKTIYDLVQNYGVAIILFTIVIKALLLPLNFKSQKAMKKQQKIPHNSARYWRTKYAQLQSDFEELLSVNQTLARRNAALEGLIRISPQHTTMPRRLRSISRESDSEYRFRQPTTKSKTIKGKKS